MAWLTPWILYRNSVFVFDFDADDRGIFDSDSKKRQFITPWTVNYMKHFVGKTIKFDTYVHVFYLFIKPWLLYYILYFSSFQWKLIGTVLY